MKKVKSDNAYTIWSVSIILCILLSVFSLIFASCAKSPENPEASPSASAAESPPPDSNTEDEPTESDNITSPSPSTTGRLSESGDAGQEYIDKVIFLGDSTTNGLSHYNVVSKNQVWTPASGTLTLALWSAATIVYPENGSEVSISEAVAAKKPEYMLITLGVNGVSFMGEESFISEYSNLVKAIQDTSPETKIILNSIYPVTSEYPQSTGITNPKIEAANLWVEAVAEACGVAYTDSASVLKMEDGSLDPNLCNGDDIHLNTDGYNAVINYIRTHAWQ